MQSIQNSIFIQVLAKPSQVDKILVKNVMLMLSFIQTF